MGDSRNNPRSRQFTGELPAYQLGVTISATEAPSAAWMESHPDYNPDRDPLPAVKDRDYVVFLSGLCVFPSELFRNEPNRWPGAELPLTAIFRMPLVDFRAGIGKAFTDREMTAPAFPEETAVEVPS